MARDLVEEYLEARRRRQRQELERWGAEQDDILRQEPAAPPAPAGTAITPTASATGLVPERTSAMREFGYGVVRGVAGIGQAVGTLAKIGGWAMNSQTLKDAGEAVATSWAGTAEAYAPAPGIRGSIWNQPELLADPQWWAASIGETVPSLAATLIPGAGAAKVIQVGGKTLAWTAPTIAKFARIGALTTGGAVGGYLEGASTYEEVKARGGTDEDAVKAMALMGLASAGMNAFSLSKLIPSPSKVAAPGLARRFVAGGLSEALTEYLESPAEAAILGDDIVLALKTGLNVVPASLVTGGVGAGIAGARRAAPEVAPAPLGAPPGAAEAAAGVAPPAEGAPAPPGAPAPAAAAAVPAAPAVTGVPAFPPTAPVPTVPAPPLPESVGAAGAGTLATAVESRVNTRHLDTTQMVRDQVELLNATPSPEVLAGREVRTTAELREAAARSRFTVEDALRITPTSTAIREEDAYRLRQYAEAATRRALVVADQVAAGERVAEWDQHAALTLAGRLVDAWELEARKAGRLLQSYNVTVLREAAGLEAEGFTERARETREFGLLTEREKQIIRELDAALGTDATLAGPAAGALTPATGETELLSRQEMAQVADLAELLRGAPDTSASYIAETLRRLLPPQQQLMALNVTSAAKSAHAAALEYWINALLSGPITQVANTLSNSLNTVWAVPQRALAARIAWARGDIQSVQAGEATVMLRGIIEGYQDGLKLAAKAWREERAQVPTIREGRLIGIPQTYGKNEIREPAIRAGAFNLEGTSIGEAIDFLGSAIRIPTTLMATADSFFRAVNFRMELKAQALRQARQEGRDGNSLTARIADLEWHPPAAVIEAANQFGLLQTFQQRPGRAGEAALSAAQNVPMLRWAVPFIRTPANMLDFTLQYTPGLNFLSKAWRDDYFAGGARRDAALARLSTGVMLTTAIGSLAAAGVVTGAGPQDPDLRREKRATGWQPYSIKVGETYYSYNRLDPIGSIIGLVANTVEVIGQMEDADALDMAGAVVFATMKNLSDKTYLEGIANLMEMIERPERGIKAWVERFAGSFVPTLFATVERAVDPVVREAHSVVDAVRARIPGYSESLPPRRNIFGEPIQLEGGWAEHLISPVYRSTEVTDPVALEMARLKANISMPSRILRGRAPAAFGAPPVPAEEVGVELSPEQYDRFVRWAGNENKSPVTRRGMKDDLAVLIESPAYRDAPSDGMRENMMRHVVTYHREAARRRLIAEDPDLRRQLQYQADVRQAARTGRPAAAIAGSLGR
jgi:hypothetical protein